jgi:hypothetical protein
VAIKIIVNDAEDPQGFVRRFEREVQLVARLKHPNIVAVYDSGEDSGEHDDLIYLVMRYVNGGTLRQRLGRPLPVSVACAALVQMCHALQHAHDAHIIHRDVKPSNMLVALDDAGRLLLTDFGIAKLQGMRGLTKSGTTMGTPEYMAPEQAEGREVDHRADIYSLGCVLYEALAGRPPFVAATPVSVLYQQVHMRPDPIRAHNPDVPRALAAVVERALAKRAQERFESADSMALALMAFTRSGALSLAAVHAVHGAQFAQAAAGLADGAPPPLGALPTGGAADGGLAGLDAEGLEAHFPEDGRDPADTHTGASASTARREGTGEARAPKPATHAKRPTRRLVLLVGALAALVVTGVVAWAALNAAGVGIAGRGPGPSATLAAPTATTKAAPTATPGLRPTATLTAQQLLDQQAAAAFQAITLGMYVDSTCASANNRTSFSASQSIYVNLCIADTAAPGHVTIVMRQAGTTIRTITRNAPVDPRSSSWYSFYTFGEASGAYDVLITYNGGTAADIAVTVG